MSFWVLENTKHSYSETHLGECHCAIIGKARGVSTPGFGEAWAGAESPPYVFPSACIAGEQ